MIDTCMGYGQNNMIHTWGIASGKSAGNEKENMIMTRGEGGCLVCGEPLIYFEEAKELECQICHKTFQAYSSCKNGHYVCDQCHEKKGIQVILDGCRQSSSKNPITIMQQLMEDPYIYMHGPEHHILVGAALLTACHNCGAAMDFPAALEEMKERGSRYPGGSCGLWGCCGAAVSVGMFISIFTKATPLTGKSWGCANQATARALAAIGALGGPRCCKRNSFTAVKEAAAFVKETFGIEMELPDAIRCDFSHENQQCLKTRCPYYQGASETFV